MANLDLAEVEDRFRDKMRERGIVPPEHLIADGKIHRCDAEGKHGKRDASYLLHMDGIPSGGVENFRDGIGWENWCSKDLLDISPLEYAHYQACVKEAERTREAELKQRRAEARDEAERIWDDAKPCTSHPYLERKRVKPHGLRALDGEIVIPMRDEAGEIHSVQRIDATGSKLYLSGGRKAGCWYTIGVLGSTICVAEGFATAASIHEATGYPVAVAFDSGNLEPVASAIRSKHPTAKIVLCADDDYKRDNNPGMTKAGEAARKVAGLMAAPDFGTARPDGATDFNDLANAQGLEVVKACIEKALATDSGPIEAAALFDLVFHEIEDRKSGEKKTTVDTGIGNVDRYTGGLRRGYLTVIAGLPGQGKTAAASGIIAHNATHGVPCLLFSIEMDRVDIGIRFVAMEAGITASHIFDDRHKFDKDGFGKVMGACDRLGKSLLTVDDRAVTATQLEEQAHLWFAHSVRAKGHDVGLIAVDYLGLIRSEGEGENRNREVAGIVQRCKLLARTLRSPVILLSQLSREAARRGSEPQLSDLRDSGEIEAAADMVIFPYPAPRDETGKIVQKPTDEVQPEDKWLIAKNRNGGKGALRVHWNPWTMHYTGIATPEDERPRDWRDR